MLAITGAQVVVDRKIVADGVVLVDNGSIAAVGTRDEIPIPTGAEIIDATGAILGPGLIDLHTHGADGVTANAGTLEALARLQRFYARHGVTGFLAGIWGYQEVIEHAMDAVIAAMAVPPDGAALLGIYLEGPFLNLERKGAFPPSTLMPPNVTLMAQYIERARGMLRLLTIAPELPGATEVIKLARAHNIVCAAGHTAANWQQMDEAFVIGVRHATHTFNAMNALHHRDPGALGYALVNDDVTTEIIADGVHVHPGAVRLLTRSKHIDGAVLITDSIEAAGMPDGTFDMEGERVTLADGAARLDDGTLAGSVLTMDRGIANLVAWQAATIPEAFMMGSGNPARVLGLNKKGQISPGADADLVAMDNNFTVRWTMVGGQIVYNAPS